MSADSVVPGDASGRMDGVALKPLTVDFHEPGFVSKLSTENGFGFWFQLSDDEQKQLGSQWGPANPQALNRYSYTQNNPIRYTDPTGHFISLVLVVVAVGVILVPGTLIAVSSSPNSGIRWSDYDWTDWSIPWLTTQTETGTGTPALMAKKEDLRYVDYIVPPAS